MNCKPGDVAVVIRDCEFSVNGHRLITNTAGRIVQVVRVEQDGWLLAEQLHVEIRGADCDCSGNGAVTHIGDEHLRPLPKLGDDEHDQAEANKPEQVAA